jgi:glycosyltransferase involved in cell wall biosynthesis
MKPVDPIRLLLVTPSLCIGGAERQLVELLQNLDPQRYVITVAVFIGADQVSQKGFYQQVSDLPNVSLRVLNRRGRFDVFGPVLSLVQLIRSEQIQLIHTFLNLASTFGLLAAKITGVPIVASAIRDSQDVSRIYRPCRVAQAWGSDVLVSNSAAGFNNRFRRWRANFKVIFNGIDLRRFEPRNELLANLREEFRLSRFDHLVGMVATVSDFKDHTAFLKVAAQVVSEMPRTGFLVIGDGPNRAAVEALSVQLRLGDNVVFTGYRHDVDVLTKLLDVACLFTNYRIISEGLPNAVMEAMACCIPVVATDDGGTVEIVSNGVEGFLVSHNDETIAADFVLRLLRDKSLRQSMGRLGRESIELKFSVAAFVSQYESLYQQLLVEKGQVS